MGDAEKSLAMEALAHQKHESTTMIPIPGRDMPMSSATTPASKISSPTPPTLEKAPGGITSGPSPAPAPDPAPSDVPADEPPPDGGTTAYLQILAGHLAVFNSWGYVISFGIFQPYYESVLGLPASSVGWIGGAQSCLILLMGAVSGRAFDAGYLRHALLLGSLLQLAGILATSFSASRGGGQQDWWRLFLAQGVCQGLGCGLVFAPTIANLSSWFARKRAVAVAGAACGGATGGIVFPLMAQQLLPRLGFAWTVRAMALVVAVAAAAMMCVVRTRPRPPRKAGPLVDWAAFGELPYVFFTCSMFFTLWATYSIYYYVRSYAVDRLSASQASSFDILMAINAIGVPGRLIPALLADRYFGAANVFIWIILGAAVSIFCWAGVHTLTGELVWVVVFGFFGAGIQALFPATLAGLTRDLRRVGTRVGMVFSIVSMAALTGPSLEARLVQAGGGRYTGLQVWGGCCQLLGAAFLVAARWASRRQAKMDEEMAS